MAKRNYLKTQRMNHAAWTRRLLIAVGILGGLFFLWSAVVGEMGIMKYYRMNAHAKTLRTEIDRLQKDNARLSREVAALRTDPAFIERLARDKIGLARPGEVVYYYGDPVR